MRAAWVALSISLLMGAWGAAAQRAAGPTIWSQVGVYTTEQAKRGNDAYQASCSSCHGTDLMATSSEAVDLTGPAFMNDWNGKTIEDAFERIRYTMPPTGPNTLSETTYMDVLAFILSVNDVPAGKQELVPETAKQIHFEKRP